MRQSDPFKQPKRPWTAGCLLGPKAPLEPKHIWAIRQQLKVAKKVRDLAMFNCTSRLKIDLRIFCVLSAIGAVSTQRFATCSKLDGSFRRRLAFCFSTRLRRWRA